MNEWLCSVHNTTLALLFCLAHGIALGSFWITMGMKHSLPWWCVALIFTFHLLHHDLILVMYCGIESIILYLPEFFFFCLGDIYKKYTMPEKECNKTACCAAWCLNECSIVRLASAPTGHVFFFSKVCVPAGHSLGAWQFAPLALRCCLHALSGGWPDQGGRRKWLASKEGNAHSWWEGKGRKSASRQQNP